jgi:hypothetical protein
MLALCVVASFDYLRVNVELFAELRTAMDRARLGQRQPCR